MGAFADVTMPGAGPARLARLQPWQRHRLQFDLRFAGIESIDGFDARRCARLVQICAVPVGSAVLMFPGGPGLEKLRRQCSEPQLRELASIALDHNEVFEHAKNIG